MRPHRHARRAGPFDLVVIADGARSTLRAQTGLVRSAVPYPFGALWFMGRAATTSHVLHQVVDGTGVMVGLLPTGAGPDGEGPLMSLFYSVRVDDLPRIRAAGLDAWKAMVRETCPAAEPVLAQIERFDQVLFTGYHDVVMNRWGTRNLVVLGDAAHATSPQLGQGSNLALMDAQALAECVRDAPDLPRALDAYERARRAHLDYYQLATRWLTPLFQSDPPGSVAPRRALPWPRVAFVREMMTASMAGVITSPFGAYLDGWRGGEGSLRGTRTTPASRPAPTGEPRGARAPEP